MTTECFTIRGCGLNNVRTVTFGTISLSPTGAFGDGSYQIVSDNELKVCPPLCLDPGVYQVCYGDLHGTIGCTEVELTAPTAPIVLCQSTHQAGTEQCVFLHNGGNGATLQFTILSWSNRPTVFPGVVSLGIGNQATEYLCGPPIFGDCGKDSLGVMPAGLAGLVLYFQSILVNTNTNALPWNVSPICMTTYF